MALFTAIILATVGGFTEVVIEPDAVVNVTGVPPTVVDTVNSVELNIPAT